MSLRSFTFTVDLRPRPWHRPRYNGKTKRFFSDESDVGQRQAIQDAFRSHVEPLVADGRLELPLRGALRLAVTAFLPLPKATPKKRRSSALPKGVPDWDNLGKQVADALQDFAYLNDAQIVTCLIRKRYAVHPLTGEDQAARWVITLEEIGDEEDPDQGPGEAAFAGTWGAR